MTGIPLPTGATSPKPDQTAGPVQPMPVQPADTGKSLGAATQKGANGN